MKLISKSNFINGNQLIRPYQSHSTPLIPRHPPYFSLSNLTWIQINKLGNLQRTPSNTCSCLIASHKIVAKKNKQDNHRSCSLDWTGPDWIALIGLTWFIRSYKKILHLKLNSEHNPS